MGRDGGVRESSLGAEIVGTVDSAKWDELGVGSTGEYGISSCCPS